MPENQPTETHFRELERPIYARWPTALLGKEDLLLSQQPEDVIGDEDRQPVTTVSNIPYRMICSLVITSANEKLKGTGWLASPKVVITAGHCIEGPELDGRAVSIRVRAGRDGSAHEFDFTSFDFDAAPQWLNGKHQDHDYGVIFLDEPLGAKTDWFTFGVMDSGTLEASRVTIAGYPKVFDDGTKQWYAENRVVGTTDRRVFYEVDTSEGESGAPVWVTAANGQRTVVGIHTAGTGATPSSIKEANSAVRITDDVFDRIRQWITSHP